MFPHYLTHDAIFWGEKKVMEHKMHVLSETCLFVGRTERVIIINVSKCSRKVPVILVRF